MNRTTIATILLLLLLVLGFSCENGGTFSIDCNECYNFEPDSADLIVYLTINAENPFVPIKIYRGDVEDEKLDWIDTVYSKEYRLYSAVDQDYSIEATYRKGTGRIIAIDGDRITTSLVTDVCDGDCWLVKGGILDVRLKE